ncbi:hypothetical protein FOA52_009013 [Chlamydomonas sp. UWO 241]|nr:hypothetical protein FOA52_009013 [Chlamydomonas sp. UWO 241]
MTLTGRGFPSTDAPLLRNTLDVRVGGVPCTVTFSNHTHVLCTTTPVNNISSSNNSSNSSSSSSSSDSDSISDPNNNHVASVAGVAGVASNNGTLLYPGMRGVGLEVYNFAGGRSHLSSLGASVTVESAGGYRNVIPDTFETPLELITRSSFCR